MTSNSTVASIELNHRPHMNYRRLTRRILLATAMLFPLTGCAERNGAPAAVVDVPTDQRDWTFADHRGKVITTPNYEIFTTVKEETLLATLPQVVETAYAYYRYLVPTAHEPTERMKIYLFAQRAEWAEFTRRFAGPRSETLLKIRNGGYMENGVAAIEYVAHQTTFPILTHECFHQFLHHCANPRVPAWLNEGLAVVCEGQRWGRVGLREFDPWHNPQRRNALAEALQKNEIFPLQRLVRMNAGHVVGGSNQKIATYYSQVWALNLFLHNGAGGRYREGYQKLLGELSSPQLESIGEAAYVGQEGRFSLGEALFRRFISDDFDTVEREFVAFMREKTLGEASAGVLP